MIKRCQNILQGTQWGTDNRDKSFGLQLPLSVKQFRYQAKARRKQAVILRIIGMDVAVEPRHLHSWDVSTESSAFAFDGWLWLVFTAQNPLKTCDRPPMWMMWWRSRVVIHHHHGSIIEDEDLVHETETIVRGWKKSYLGSK